MTEQEVTALLEQNFNNMKLPGPFTNDILEHLDTLRNYASKCDHVTEMGFRAGTSFMAFLAAQPKKLITYDIHIDDELVKAFTFIRGKTEVVFRQENTLATDIEETDLLFIDTFHSFTQLHCELRIHGNKARKFIILHDTESCRYRGEDGLTPGLEIAVDIFLKNNDHWKIREIKHYNNGLTVLERR